MIQTALTSILLASSLSFAQAEFPNTASAQLQAEAKQAQTELASASMSLNKRYGGADMPDNVYKDNILLNIAYMNGTVKSKNDINWDSIKKPFTTTFTLNPGERFAYHDTQLAQYADNVVLTTNSTFSAGDGYKYEGGLYGMGVCHLASLINKAALNAGLESVAPSNHDFYPIPEISKEYGVAIYFDPNAPLASARQNLYIKNTLEKPITFKFDFDGDNLKVSVLKSS